MEKRLTRTEMLFSLGFILMLIVAVAAFFVGIKVGADKTEAKYAPANKLNGDAEIKVTAYQQQDLVSFYHTVFLPYREFVSQWVADIDKMKTGLSTDPSAKLKELSALADKQYAEASKATVSRVSPLLVQSHTNVLKSLKLFAQAAERSQSEARSTGAAGVVAQLGKDAYYRQALEFALIAQQQYYTAMLKWSASLDPNMPADVETAGNMDLNAWKTQPLVIKNKLMADQLERRKLLTSYYPQDLTARVDLFLSSGQADRMRTKSVNTVVDLLIGTEAIRIGDFTANKARFYGKELLPQLPFFVS
ncbi:hypothetical protein BG53_00760 [Paenibacillus darwinianus]|uniref:Uncharacterized protein n=1 Tax=Paenibacillus darwinianus TaxID=1380763 RepID=A0A9W5S3P1_9BACL|nr:hypothetical protein [Paenibacillus darwinianus]EXX91459.1 hypothetical protein BG52_10230 [Paenibacillus darwinianus]EXX92256.1 hypothetical protein BG53_00760 [Paenibacillus darwinianus]EXX92270.1 hypothetical protein CH50_11655 [Paenibacillus darwinianus]